MSKDNEKGWQEYLDNSIPGYSRRVNLNKIKNTQENNMKSILFGITSLTLGGAERVLVDIANRLSDKFDITIFTIYGNGELEKQLSDKVKLKTLNEKSYSELSSMQKKLVMPLKMLFSKKKIYNENIKNNYDIEIAFLEGPITRLFSIENKNKKENIKTRKIAWVHNDISLVFGKGIKSKIKRILDKKTYKKYEKLIFVSKDNMQKFEEFYPEIKTKKEVIYNYIDKEIILKKAQEELEIDKQIEFKKDKINFISVARLTKQKGIDRIIKMHKQLIEEGLQHNFYVIGDGPEKGNLEKLIIKENIQNTFHLLGKKENPYPLIKQANYFCLLSHFEGYGMVLEEAKILQKNIIITDTAAREAVSKYENSQIVKNSENGIYEGLKKAISQNENLNKNVIKQEYNNENILNQIIKLMEG